MIKRHYIAAFHRDLSNKLGVDVPVLLPKGDLHLLDAERLTPLVAGRYWLIIAGGKSDITTKIWSAARFQQVVDLLRDHGIHCVQDGAVHPGHHHPVLHGVTSLVGKTNLRDVLRLVYRAEGVICPVTFFMHVAAAFDKPCVVLAGGREPWWWEAYSAAGHVGPRCVPTRVPHRYFHTIGSLECCKDTGCWKTHVAPGGTGVSDRTCVSPIDDGHGQAIPLCLGLITAEAVVDAVLGYYANGAIKGTAATPHANRPSREYQLSFDRTPP
ncbi:MAG: glycosyltransferase family 9 protein [Deltaproteobacteria bacterium]|nr:glycosyltransferase family 9 protein [Deltaproteobacteria bacterium]